MLSVFCGTKPLHGSAAAVPLEYIFKNLSTVITIAAQQLSLQDVTVVRPLVH